MVLAAGQAADVIAKVLQAPPWRDEQYWAVAILAANADPLIDPAARREQRFVNAVRSIKSATSLPWDNLPGPTDPIETCLPCRHLLPHVRCDVASDDAELCLAQRQLPERYPRLPRWQVSPCRGVGTEEYPVESDLAHLCYRKPR